MQALPANIRGPRSAAWAFSREPSVVQAGGVMEDISGASRVQAPACCGHLQVRAASLAGELVFEILDCSTVADIRKLLATPADTVSLWAISGDCAWPLLDDDFLQPLQCDGVVRLSWRRRAPLETYDIRNCHRGDSQSLSKKTQANLPLEMFLLGLRSNPKAFKPLVPEQAYAFLNEYENVKVANRRLQPKELFDYVQAWWLKDLVAERGRPAVAP